MEMVLTIMYDGWQHEMDKHAAKILILADYLLADELVNAAICSLKRFRGFEILKLAKFSVN